MMLSFLDPYFGLGSWVLRIALAAVFVYHGIPKLKTPSMVASIYGAPSFVGFIHGLVEVLGGLALVLGIYDRLAALALSVIMLGALYFHLFKWRTPFNKQGVGPGWEFELVLLGGLLTLLLG